MKLIIIFHKIKKNNNLLYKIIKWIIIYFKIVKNRIEKFLVMIK